jgi:hypothetical protein
MKVPKDPLSWRRLRRRGNQSEATAPKKHDFRPARTHHHSQLPCHRWVMTTPSEANRLNVRFPPIAGIWWSAILRQMRGPIFPSACGAIIIVVWKFFSFCWPSATKRILPFIAVFAGWAWFLFAGGGGLGILLIRGPWPPTNGWFALLSGLAACPVTGRLSRNCAHLRVSGWQQFTAALLLVTLGCMPLNVWPQPNPL